MMIGCIVNQSNALQVGDFWFIHHTHRPSRCSVNSNKARVLSRRSQVSPTTGSSVPQASASFLDTYTAHAALNLLTAALRASPGSASSERHHTPKKAAATRTLPTGCQSTLKSRLFTSIAREVRCANSRYHCKFQQLWYIACDFMMPVES